MTEDIQKIEPNRDDINTHSRGRKMHGKSKKEKCAVAPAWVPTAYKPEVQPEVAWVSLKDFMRLKRVYDEECRELTELKQQLESRRSYMDRLSDDELLRLKTDPVFTKLNELLDYYIERHHELIQATADQSNALLALEQELEDCRRATLAEAEQIAKEFGESTSGDGGNLSAAVIASRIRMRAEESREDRLARLHRAAGEGE